MAVKICPQCGTRYEADSRFCTLDGAALVAENPADSLVGTVLAERYLVQEKLGEGGMGEVYLAEHVRMKRKVAVKVMRRSMVSDPEAIGRFHREAENASQITHPNVAAVYDFGETPDRLAYLAMEYVPGEPLTRILERERRVHHVRATDLVSQIADALAAAHALGILHRDLKPDNVMIAKTRLGTDLVKLLDFGIARVMGRETQHLTRTGLVVGTPEWMSPEQISGDKLDARADIYALGLMAYQFLTGVSAFAGANSQEIMLAKMTRPPRRLAEVRPDVEWPDALQEAFDRVLATDPARRYDDALAFARDFYAAVAPLPLTPEAETYLSALSQRMVTPTHGLGLIEPTPPRGMPTIPTPVPHLTRDITPASTRPAVAFDPTQAETALGVATPPPRPAMSVPPVVDESAEPETEEAPDEQTPPATEVVPPPVPPEAAGEAQPAWRRLPIVPAAGIAAALLTALLLFKGGSAPAPAQLLTSDSLTLADSAGLLAGDSTVADSSSAPATTGSVRAALDAAARASGNSVFGVVSKSGRGSGFLADSTGIVLTAAAVVGTDSVVDVFLDAGRRVAGRVIAHQRELAALLIPMGYCPARCEPLPLAADTVSLATGDSIAGVTAPVLASSFRSAAGRIATAGPNLTARIALRGRRLGAPILRPDSQVVAIAHSGTTSTVTLALAQTARELLSTARETVTRQRLTPIDGLLPSWPSRAVSTRELADGRSRTAAQIDTFHVRQDPFDVFVMTPQVIAWRVAQAERMRQNANPMAIDQPQCQANQRICDPIERWSPPWTEYQDERRAVVMVQVSPAIAPAPNMGVILSSRRDRLEFRSGNFQSLRLTSDGREVMPIETVTFPAVANASDYERPPFLAGLYVFHPRDFVTESGAPRQVTLTVWDQTRANRPIQIQLPPALLQAVARDVAGFVRY